MPVKRKLRNGHQDLLARWEELARRIQTAVTEAIKFEESGRRDLPARLEPEALSDTDQKRRSEDLQQFYESRRNRPSTTRQQDDEYDKHSRTCESLQSQADKLMRDSLRWLNLAKLEENPVYQELKAVDLTRPLDGQSPTHSNRLKGLWANVENIIAIFRGALDFSRPREHRGRFNHRQRQRAPAVLQVYAKSVARAKNVAQLRYEFEQIPERLDAQQFESLRTDHPDWLLFRMAAKVPEVKHTVIETHDTPLQRALTVASVFHHRKFETIEDDWSHRKSRKEGTHSHTRTPRRRHSL